MDESTALNGCTDIRIVHIFIIPNPEAGYKEGEKEETGRTGKRKSAPLVCGALFLMDGYNFLVYAHKENRRIEDAGSDAFGVLPRIFEVIIYRKGNIMQGINELGRELDVPNETTTAAIKEGRRIATDNSVKGYSDMESLKKALTSPHFKP